MTENLKFKVEFEADEKTHMNILEWGLKELGEGNFDYFTGPPNVKSCYYFRTNEAADMFRKQFIHLSSYH